MIRPTFPPVPRDPVLSLYLFCVKTMFILFLLLPIVLIVAAVIDG
jgi:hypothetical protein